MFLASLYASSVRKVTWFSSISLMYMRRCFMSLQIRSYPPDSPVNTMLWPGLVGALLSNLWIGLLFIFISFFTPQIAFRNSPCIQVNSNFQSTATASINLIVPLHRSSIRNRIFSMRSQGTTLKRPLKMQRLFKSRIGTLPEPLSIKDFIKDHLTANTPTDIPLSGTPIQLYDTVSSPKSIPLLEVASTESKQPFQVKEKLQHFLIKQQQTGRNSLICNLSVEEQLSTSNNGVKEEQEKKRQANIEERIICIEQALAQNFGNCNMIKSKYYSKRTKKNDSVSLCLKRQSRLSCVLGAAKPPQELKKIGSVDTLSSTHRRAFRKPSKQYYDIYLHEREEYSPNRMLLNKTSYSMDYPKKSVGVCSAFKPIDNLGREGEFRKEGSQNGGFISIYNKEHGRLCKGSPVSYDYTGMDCFRDKHTPINISFLSYSSKVSRGGKIKPSKEIRVSKSKENNVCSILSSFKTGYGYDISGRYRTETGQFGRAIAGAERAVTKDAQLSRLKNAYRFGMTTQFQ